MLSDDEQHAAFVLFLFVAYIALEDPMVRVVRGVVAGIASAVAIAWLLVGCA